MKSLDTTLLPDFSRLRSEAGWNYTMLNYVESRGTYELGVAFAQLFWPDFREFRGCIIRADSFDEQNFDRWWERTGGDATQIESVLNLLHVDDLVPSDTTELDHSVFEYLGNAIAEMWRCRLAQLFPGRDFVVRFAESNGTGLTVTAIQTR